MVQGKRHLTNMTDQMTATEKKITRFLPMTGDKEAAMGYDKFELGAVMIEDGFQVYDHLKNTKNIIVHLQEAILNKVFPANKHSIIQFYLRQIKIFCAVMADLNLFHLMEQIVDFYKVQPPNKKSQSKKNQKRQFSPWKRRKPLQRHKKEHVMDPKKKYNF